HDESRQRHHHHADRGVDDAGGAARDEDRRAPDGQGPEAVDDPLVEVVAQPRGHDERRERHGLRHDPRQQPLAVVDLAGHGDGAAEDKGEEQDEHYRLDGDVGEVLGLAPDVEEVAAHQRRDLSAERRSVRSLRDLETLVSGLHGGLACGGAHPWGSSVVVSSSGSPECSALRPVRDRNTSSRLGRWSPMSSSSMPASVNAAAIPASAETPSDGAVIRRASRSTWRSAIRAARMSTARSTSSGRETVTTRLAAPERSLSSSGVPSAMTPPWSITITRSANWSASSRYCVVSSSVVPSRTRSRSTSQSSLRERGSSPVVGSSRNSTGGAATRLAARSSRRRMPPEYVLAGRVAASASENFSSSSSARARTCLAGSPYRSPMRRRFSRPVSSSSTVADWAVSPIERRTAAGSRSTSWPATRAVPEVGGLRVVIIRTTVVLPAPLGPSRPSTVP